MLRARLLPFALLASAVPAQVGEFLVVERTGRSARSLVATDAVAHALAAGTWAAPVAGAELAVGGGRTREWRRVEAEDGGVPARTLRGGWAFATVEVPAATVAIATVRGARAMYVNGVPRVGDLYDLGITAIPVALRAGRNELLLKAGRGTLRVALETPAAPLSISALDPTLPDAVAGVPGPWWAGVIVTNATADWLTGLRATARCGDGAETAVDVPPLPPCSNHKLAVPVAPPAAAAGESVPLRVAIAGAHAAERTFALRVRRPDQGHVRTFRSAIDGSAQFWALTPAADGGEDRPALILSLHGAAVDARNQAAAYAQKDWAHVVAPTNRRPFGFDWEDQGRLDALEVLAQAEQALRHDPRRVYLTGHSMGGHGTWQLGAHFPARFAAIAPSAGWRDFWSYGGGIEFAEPGPVERLLLRAANASRTDLLAENYALHGVYVLHGDADDNVPVAQARAMRTRLAEFHPDWAYHERPGAGHWWGNACVDWPPLLAFLRERTLPDAGAAREVAFRTVSPGVSARCRWVTVEDQRRPLEVSSVRAARDDAQRALAVTTDNVTRLALDVSALAAGGEVAVQIDGQDLALPWPADATLRLAREGERWRAAAPIPPAHRSPARTGPFKNAFRNRAVFVCGTAGTDEENAWSLAKARYDAETFWYRGNGAFEVVTDRLFLAGDYRGRNVVLYGHRDGNAAFAAVVPAGAAIDVARGALRAGDRTLRRTDLGVLAVLPRADDDTALCAVVGGTGPAGMRATDHLPYFVSGVGVPDWVVVTPELWAEGAAGVLGCGFFAADWSVAADDSAWR